MLDTPAPSDSPLGATPASESLPGKANADLPRPVSGASSFAPAQMQLAVYAPGQARAGYSSGDGQVRLVNDAVLERARHDAQLYFSTEYDTGVSEAELAREHRECALAAAAALLSEDRGVDHCFPVCGCGIL